MYLTKIKKKKHYLQSTKYIQKHWARTNIKMLYKLKNPKCVCMCVRACVNMQ